MVFVQLLLFDSIYIASKFRSFQHILPNIVQLVVRFLRWILHETGTTKDQCSDVTNTRVTNCDFHMCIIAVVHL